jgi:hypothetical protein
MLDSFQLYFHALRKLPKTSYVRNFYTENCITMTYSIHLQFLHTLIYHSVDIFTLTPTFTCYQLYTFCN